MWYTIGGVVLAAATRIRDRAYAPYSHHPVGAAASIILPDGTPGIVVGVNVENAVNGISSCAEDSLVANIVIAGAVNVTEIVIVGPNGILPPCGKCRQLLSEHVPSDTRVNAIPLRAYLPYAPVIDIT